MSVYDFNEGDTITIETDDEDNEDKTIQQQRGSQPASRSIFDPVAMAYLDKHYYEILGIPRPTYAPIPSPTQSEPSPITVPEIPTTTRKTDNRIQRTSTGCHVQPKVNFTEGSPDTNFKQNFIDQLHWNPVVVVSRLDSEFDQEIARLQNSILEFEYPKNYFEERELFQNFWKLLLSSRYITLVGDFFIGPNGTYYKPSVRFNNRKEWLALQLKLKTFDQCREGGHSWESYIWQKRETVTAQEAAKVIKRELLKLQSSIMGKPCGAVLESLINQNKHGKIEKTTKKGQGFQWHFNRHSWNIVAWPTNTLVGSKGLELVKIDSLYPKLRKKDIQISRAISVPIQGFFVRSDISELIPDNKCILESFLVAIRVLLKGDDCRKNN